MTGTLLTDAGSAVHVPVLLDEVIEFLRAREGGMFLDCTFGGGGHTRAILDAHPESWVVAVDRDVRAVERGRSWAARYGDRLEVHHSPFSRVRDVVAGNRFDGILADLGMSTDQLKEGRGFSFVDDGSLDMRMDEGSGESAKDFINSATEREIFLAMAEGGVGKNAHAIARLIARERPFESAFQLAAAIKGSRLGKPGESKAHAATVVFQALRMKVNGEREQIDALLDRARELAKPGGRLAVITFHSLEDQIVMGRMREWASAGSYPASWRGPRVGEAIGTLITKKAVVPSDEELERNPASRSARLRVFEFCKV